jgi:hypothetical protein
MPNDWYVQVSDTSGDAIKYQRGETNMYDHNCICYLIHKTVYGN